MMARGWSMASRRRRRCAVDDRGLHYGDGLFETMRCTDGRVRFLEAHLRAPGARLRRLGIVPPDWRVLRSRSAAMLADAERAASSSSWSRAAWPRGYAVARPVRRRASSRCIAAPRRADARVCAALVRDAPRAQPALAGIKHLNRLEQVLARAEWHDGRIVEGLMLDTEGDWCRRHGEQRLPGRDGVLVTPDCGLRRAGVMRAEVLRWWQRCPGHRRQRGAPVAARR